MWHFKSHDDRALYLWDYFYVSHLPGPGEDKDWKVIENAMCRLREAVAHLASPLMPADERVRHARRGKAAVTPTMKHLPRISHVEPWVHAELAELATFVAQVIATHEGDARRVVVH